MDIQSEPYVLASVTAYLNNMRASFDIRIHAKDQRMLEEYCSSFRTRSMHLKANGWMVSKVCGKI
jgi:hypothetical protein